MVMNENMGQGFGEGVEENIERQIFTQQNEKTFIDKVLGREDVMRLKELVMKDNLTRGEMLEVLYLLSGTEAKLVNYGAYDRYVILKFFVWIREFIKIAELMYDYAEDVGSHKVVLNNRCSRLLNNNMRLMQHNYKFLIDLYLNIARTTLSIGATGMLELLKNKFEIYYPNKQTSNNTQQYNG